VDKYKRSQWSLQFFTQCSDLKLASMSKVLLALLVSATPKNWPWVIKSIFWFLWRPLFQPYFGWFDCEEQILHN
jgi:hypothetical protein